MQPLVLLCTLRSILRQGTPKSASNPGEAFHRNRLRKDRPLERKTDAIAEAGLLCSKSLPISYTIKEIHELPLAQFDFLIANITDFVRRHKLSEWLYRDDIDRGIQAKFFDPEEDAVFKEFLKSSFPFSV